MSVSLLLEKLDIDWSKLSAVGRQPMVRLVIFAPLLAQVLLLKPQHDFLAMLDLGKMHWAYWSLIAFSIAQITYMVFCPQDIKLYPNRYDYIRNHLNTSTDFELWTQLHELYKKLFTKFGGHLDVDMLNEQQLEKEFAKDNMRRVRNQDYTWPENFDLQLRMLYLSINEDNPRIIDWENVLHYVDDISTTFFPENEDTKNGIEKFTQILMHYATGDHWRTHLIAHGHDELNLSRKKIRTFIFIMYFLGFSYFVWVGFGNVFRVLITYF